MIEMSFEAALGTIAHQWVAEIGQIAIDKRAARNTFLRRDWGCTILPPKSLVKKQILNHRDANV